MNHKGQNKKRITLNKLFKLGFLSLTLLIIIVIVFYGLIFGNKTNAESVTQDTVLTQIAEHLVLPNTELLSLMRISNAKELANQDVFYKDVKNGDYIAVFENLILIYDFDKSLIKNIKTK